MNDVAYVTALLRQRDADGAWRLEAAVAEREAGFVFVPGDLPCGDCSACRRALVSACARPQRLPADLSLGAPLPSDLPHRFTYDGAANVLAAREALWAGVVAPLLEGMGRAGLGAGDVSLWLGSSPMALLGASLAASRGSKAILVGPPHLAETLAQVEATDERARPLFLPWHQLDEVTLRQLAETPSGPVERHLYVMGDETMAWTAATHLLGPGTTLVAWGGAPALAGLPGDARVFTLGSRFNPDFVPEALAALSHHPDLLKTCVLLTTAGMFDVVTRGLA